MGSCLNTYPRVLEMGLKRVYTLLRSWNHLEDTVFLAWHLDLEEVYSPR